MKNLYTFLLSILIPVAGFAQFTTPDGSQSYTLDDLVSLSEGTVTFDDGAYQINNDLIVSITDTLKINEDVVVRFAVDVLVTIKGGFYVNSNSLFTNLLPETVYKGFRLEDENVVHLQGATFEYGGGFKALSGNLTVIDCMVRYQTYKTGSSGAMDISSGKPYFENTTFFENERGGIGGPANKIVAPTILNCTFTGNTTSNQLRPQINLGPSGMDTIIIMNNIITGYPEHNRAGGIAIMAGSITHAIISGNVITNNQYGITSNGLSFTRIVGNIIEDNNTGGIPATGGSGINILGNGDMNHVILDNEIRGNLWGITTQLNGKINMGDLDDETDRKSVV